MDGAGGESERARVECREPDGDGAAATAGDRLTYSEPDDQVWGRTNADYQRQCVPGGLGTAGRVELSGLFYYCPNGGHHVCERGSVEADGERRECGADVDRAGAES